MRGSVVLDQPDTSRASFWKCKEYQRTVKRVESANKICSTLVQLVQERALLERQHAANLKKWSQNVMSFLDSGMEYGTGAFLWKALCGEAEAVSNAHEAVCTVLMTEVRACIKKWQKEHFQKASMPPQTLKQSKEFERDFERVQKPWVKLSKKVLQAKKDYYQACQTERSLQVQVQNAKTDPAGTPEQLKKIQEKLANAVKEMERAKSAYTNALAELDEDNPRYLEGMTRVFNKSQDLERERLTFCTGVFSDLHQAFNVTTKADFNAIYNEMMESIKKCDVEKDLAWWSSNHGVDMPVVLAQFEEYSPELNSIGSRHNSRTLDSSSGVTVTGITPVSSEEGSNTNDLGVQGPTTTNGHQVNEPNPFSETSPPTSASVPPGPESMTTHSSEAVVDEYAETATYDDGRPGVLVRALYDYKTEEEDELKFVTGDVFEKLGEPDDQGWCLGRKDGLMGLYPANYVQLM